MIPINSSNLTKNISSLSVDTTTSQTYKLNTEKDRIHSKVDGLSAIEQAIYKILMTERYTYVAYNWSYGIELSDLFGQQMPYVKSEIERRIADALLVDDRIKSIENFSYRDIDKTTLDLSFTVITIDGNININKVVDFGV